MEGEQVEFDFKEQICFKPRSEIKQKWSHFISREVINLLWNLKQNISSLINQNKLWAVCTIQILGIYVAWGWGSPPTGQKQQVLERWQYLRCRAQAGLSHWPLLHVVLVPPVPLWACSQQIPTTCRFLSPCPWFQVAADSRGCLRQPCWKIQVEFGDRFPVPPLLI